ncbi:MULTISPECIES: CdaR family transcriptional regulator [Paenibacillus]|uniref:PucR family transcriptional regulator n=1 Tax=Paenibacillus TaxID=44249 RepID=UPI0004325EE0|nr:MULTISPECIES: helix-turn-helix domain-containing protein [Paenibacillus]KKC48536.1 hypothetical protein VE23_17985 [Paenibacillus sp. D9]CDN44811.1 Putative transcriptional regulator, PucR family [Paenibacillus sp. P22]
MASGEWLEELRGILGTDLDIRQFSAAQWRDMAGGGIKAEQNGNWIVDKDRLVVRLAGDGIKVECLEIHRTEPLSETEIRLLRLTLKYARPERAWNVKPATGMEKTAAELGRWINGQLDSSRHDPLPASLAEGGRLYAEMIPILLVREYPGAADDSYSELEKLLLSFFPEEVLLIPLQRNEWLILSPVSLLRDSQLEGTEEDESEEESLKSIGLGLHEMLASEWLGECHLALSLPMQPLKSLVDSAALLKETIELGRRFHVGSNLHLPWQLNLERLLSAIPERERSKFIEQTLSRSDYYMEPEILTTLETFFALDCNVSETAKKLYIHRNTLLYRLDKLKQETGLDVRLFRDAVMVKIILLLDKVTKRP